MCVLQSPAPVPAPAQTVKEEPPVPKPDPTQPPVQKEKSDAAKVTEDDDLEKELELDLENVKIDDTIDPSVSTQHILFSCASAKAERSLSSLYSVFLCGELGGPLPQPGFHGSVPKRCTTFV